MPAKAAFSSYDKAGYNISASANVLELFVKIGSIGKVFENETSVDLQGSSGTQNGFKKYYTPIDSYPTLRLCSDNMNLKFQDSVQRSLCKQMVILQRLLPINAHSSPQETGWEIPIGAISSDFHDEVSYNDF